jgi:alpha-N-arabinofuranosidase
MRRLSAVVWSLALASSLAWAAETIAIPNASFEDAQADKPAGWTTKSWNGEPAFEYAAIGHTGAHSVSVASEKGADAAWQAVVPVKPFSRYRLSGWIKTENVVATTGRGALINAHAIEGAQTPALTGTHDWTRVEVEFDVTATDALEINCLLGGWGLATGRAWYDDLALELLSTKELKPTMLIDATQTRAPISKYIYGQFIEHLGRCIYGGIWSELLEDRKFYYPVGAEASPWKSLGETTMAKDNPYSGEQTPEIQGGIAQGSLALRKGKAYVGRVVLSGAPEAAPVVLRVVWGPNKEDAQEFPLPAPTADYVKTPFQFTAAADTDDGRLEIVASGQGKFRVGAVSLMPADNVHGMRADTLAVLKELNSPVYRWPGGNFVSGYDWHDGLGDPDRRPTRKNPAWKGIEPNDFGIDEFMTFCREVGTEPYITVNSGKGDVSMAVDELEYANGAADTPQGKRRAEAGRPEPYGVKFWSVGNEMYGDWQLGHMPLADYVKKHNTFAEAMRAKDPSITIVAVGATGCWSEGMLAGCADHMDLLSEHFYCQGLPNLMAHVRQMTDNVRAKANAQRRYWETIPALKDKRVPIALDEWNYWYGNEVFGELGTRYFLRDALGIAAGLHEYFRNSDVFQMANYAQTVNVIGAVKTTKTDAAMETTGLALTLYRREFGSIPVFADGSTEPLDAVAAWTQDRKAITVGIVNPTRTAQELAFTLEGAKLTGNGRAWTIAGPDDQAYNQPGAPPNVTIEQTQVTNIHNKLPAAPISVTLYRLDVE